MRRQKHTDPISPRSAKLPEHPEPAGRDRPGPDSRSDARDEARDEAWDEARGGTRDDARGGGRGGTAGGDTWERETQEAALRAIAQQLTDDPGELMRRIREAGRERIREARDASREAARQLRETQRELARQARETEQEMIRQAREAEREAARHLRGGHRAERGRDADEPDTRSRIQQVALELFTENGYEATSLREIAERLGVTKAALYYHFRTKDDIIDSLVHDRLAKLSELIGWASQQPRTVQTRREALRRYSAMLDEQGNHGLMRFFERNQSSMTQHRAGVLMRDRMLEMLEVLSDRDAPLQDQIRCSLAIFALHSTWFTVRDPQVTDDQRREAALEVALDLVEPRGPVQPRSLVEPRGA